MRLVYSIALSLACVFRVITNVFWERWDPMTIYVKGQKVSFEDVTSTGGRLLFIGMAVFELICIVYAWGGEQNKYFKLVFGTFIPFAAYDVLKQAYLDPCKYDAWEHWGLVLTIPVFILQLILLRVKR